MKIESKAICACGEEVTDGHSEIEIEPAGKGYFIVTRTYFVGCELPLEQRFAVTLQELAELYPKLVALLEKEELEFNTKQKPEIDTAFNEFKNDTKQHPLEGFF